MTELRIKLIKQVVEASLLVAGKPLNVEQIQLLFGDENAPDKSLIKQAIVALQNECEDRSFEIVEVASGFRYQIRPELSHYVGRLWEEKPQRYSRALLETLALIAYRQPTTRGDIEEIRGVAVSSNIMKTLLDRNWIKVVGHKDVPGRPSLYATTKQFLDYFNLKGLDELPALSEIRDLEEISREIELKMEPGQHSLALDDTAENTDQSGENITSLTSVPGDYLH